jgi:hypothetical protein
LLTTYGCDYGFIHWQIGDILDTTATVLNPQRQRTEYGPGYYKARCMGDFSTNTDWVTVFVGSDGSITPLISGPSRMCPNTATTITTTGCPYGYYNLWNTIENGGWQYGGNSITIYTPQTVKFRCNKDDNSFATEEKSLLIEPAFPDDVKAKNNGPVVLGNPASITATDIPGATYLWTVPTGALFSNLNSRALQVASATEEYAGAYSVRVTYGSCALDLKTTLEISACENLYIKAYNPITGTETNKLTRKPGVANKNEYEELILEVQTLDGKVIKTMDYTWDPNPNLIKSSNINEQYKAQTAIMGHYVVTVSKNTISCPLSIDIFAEPCTVVGDLFTCGNPGGAANNNDQANISNLAVGDEFTTSDYTIVVTEMESGSQTAGWKGKGKLIFNFLKLSNNLALQIPISVTFTGIKINQCYQLYNGTVITEYDPSWSSVVSADQIKNQLSGVYTEIKDLLANAVENAALLQQKIKDLRAARADLVNAEFTLEYKTEQLAALDAAISGMVCLAGEPPSSGNRMSVTLNSSICDAASVGASIDAAKVAGENSKINKWAGDVFGLDGFKAELSKPGKNIIIYFEEKYFLYSDFQFNTNNVSITEKILAHYSNEIPYLAGHSFSSKLNAEQYSLYTETNSPHKIGTGLIDGKTSSLLNNKYNLINALYHESIHLALYKENGNSQIRHYGIGHAEIHLNMANHSSFIETTADFRQISLKTLFDYAINEGVLPITHNNPPNSIAFQAKRNEVLNFFDNGREKFKKYGLNLFVRISLDGESLSFYNGNSQYSIGRIVKTCNGIVTRDQYGNTLKLSKFIEDGKTCYEKLIKY